MNLILSDVEETIMLVDVEGESIPAPQRRINVGLLAFPIRVSVSCILNSSRLFSGCKTEDGHALRPW